MSVLARFTLRGFGPSTKRFETEAEASDYLDRLREKYGSDAMLVAEVVSAEAFATHIASRPTMTEVVESYEEPEGGIT